MPPIHDPLSRHIAGDPARAPIPPDEVVELGNPSRRIFGMTTGQLIIFVTQIVAIVGFAMSVKSDVRDATTRIGQHDAEISDIKKDRERDGRDINAKLNELSTNVGILLERTKPGH